MSFPMQNSCACGWVWHLLCQDFCSKVSLYIRNLSSTLTLLSPANPHLHPSSQDWSALCHSTEFKLKGNKMQDFLTKQLEIDLIKVLKTIQRLPTKSIKNLNYLSWLTKHCIGLDPIYLSNLIIYHFFHTLYYTPTTLVWFLKKSLHFLLGSLCQLFLLPGMFFSLIFTHQEASQHSYHSLYITLPAKPFAIIYSLETSSWSTNICQHCSGCWGKVLNITSNQGNTHSNHNEKPLHSQRMTKIR